MPEGPEIRIAADRIAKVLVNEVVEDVALGLKRLERFRQQLLGRRVIAVDTRGKAMLTRFDNDLTLYSHNQLYGRWYVRPRGQLPNTGRSLRVALHTRAASALLYSASDIHVMTAQELAEHPFLARLGPDIMDPNLSWRALARRLRQPEFARRALSSLYLDQGFVAGNGNYLRSEVLHFARIRPGSRPADLSAKQRNLLARETLAVARRSYTTRGITNPPARVKLLKSEGAMRSEYRFAVFGRDGMPCYTCQSTIQRATAGSRRIYYCPNCQE